ncbi:MAG: hypothetical protein JXA92_02665 [candidate division Zixibacteria bacterium]|nr:hypothetical protein [candidate division Zixibacteria bacterium]
MDKNKILIISPLKGIWQDIPKMFDPEKWQIVTIDYCVKGRELLNNDPSIDLIIVNANLADNCGLNFLKWIKNFRGRQAPSPAPIL